MDASNDPFFPELSPSIFFFLKTPFRAFVTFLLPCTPTAPYRTSVSRNGTISRPFPLLSPRQRVRSGKRREGGGGKGKKSGEKMGARIERLLPLGAIVVVVVVAVTGGDAFSTTESLPYRSLLFSDRESVTGRNYLPTCSSLFILASLLLLLEAKRNLAPSRRKGANPSLSPLQLPFRLIPAGQLILSLINLGTEGDYRNRMRFREEIEHAPLLLHPRFVVRKISNEREGERETELPCRVVTR